MKPIKFLFIVLILFLLSFSVIATDHGKLKISNGNVDVEFLDNIISDKDKNVLLNEIKTDKYKVSIDSLKYPELNKKAKLTFKNCDYSRPTLFHNGLLSSVEVTKSKQKKECYAVVDSFSTWEIHDNTFEGTMYNMTIYNGKLGLKYDAIMIVTGNTSDWTDHSVWNTTPVYVGMYYNATAGWNGTGAFQGNGTAGKTFVNISKVSNPNIDFKNDSGYTLTWFGETGVKTNTPNWFNRRSTYGYVAQTSGTAWTLDAFWDTTAGNSNCVGVGSPYNDSKMHFFAIRYFGNNTREVWMDNTRQIVCNNNNPFNETNINSLMIGSSLLGTLANLQGTMDEIKIFNRSITNTEILELNRSNRLHKYIQSGHYLSEIYNSTDYNHSSSTNVWSAILVPNISTQNTNITINGRAGNCSDFTTTKPWVTGTNAGNNFSFIGTDGECFQYNLSLYSDGDDTFLFENITIQSTLADVPIVTNINITPINPKLTENIRCEAQYLINGSTTAEIFFYWYVNNNLVSTQSITPVSNGSINFTIINNTGSLLFGAGDEINCTVKVITTTGVISANITSSTITSWVYSLYGTCTDEIVEESTCTFYSGNLNCSDYTYNISKIVNNTVLVPVTSGNLTLFSGNIYLFNLVSGYDTSGSYFTTFCDGSVKPFSIIKQTNEIYKLMFIISLILVFGVTIAKLFNLLSMGTLYNIEMAFTLFFILMIGWVMGIIVVMTDYTLTYSIMFMISSFFLVLNIIFLISEILLMMKQKLTPKGSYNTNKQE